MIKSLALMTLIVCGATIAAGQDQKPAAPKATSAVQTVKFFSNSLGEERAFNILLPVDYKKSRSRYPVLYLLHGQGKDQNHTVWEPRTAFIEHASKLEAILVMPDGGQGFYVNSVVDPKSKLEDLIIKDLIPYIDSQYRTRPDRDGRAVAGFSMGGFGAALFGLKHYDKFGAFATLSGPVNIARNVEGMDMNSKTQKLFGAPFTPERLERDPLTLVTKVPADQMPLIYMACGGQDFMLDSSRQFAKLLSEKKIPYEYREVSPGGHSWEVWDEHLNLFVDILVKKKGWGMRPEKK